MGQDLFYRELYPQKDSLPLRNRKAKEKPPTRQTPPPLHRHQGYECQKVTIASKALLMESGLIDGIACSGACSTFGN